MITNAQQYQITQAQVAKFVRAFAHVLTAPAGGGPVHPRLQEAQADALRSQLADLQAQVAAYDAHRVQAHPDS